jgi:hypothetical protein
VLKPLARHYGVRKQAKLDRFAEQGYAVIYFTGSGLLGLVSSSLPLSGDAETNLPVLLAISGLCISISRRGTSAQNTLGSVRVIISG